MQKIENFENFQKCVGSVKMLKCECLRCVKSVFCVSKVFSSLSRGVFKCLKV